MVTYLNKWLLLVLVPALCTGNGFPVRNVEPATYEDVHPLHVSVTEINHNATEKTLEISCKLFTDDFETILSKTYEVKVDLINPANRAAIEKLVNDYIHKHLTIKVDGKAIPFSFLGYERDNDAIYVYFQVDNISSVKKMEIKDSILHDMFTDQINLLHTIVAGVRKSTKLDYPAVDAVVNF
jgi:hypothetical protein